MASIAVVVFLGVAALSAHAGQSEDSVKASSTRVGKQSNKPINISGTVGSEGKTLVSDKGNRIWNVANPDSLKPSEGRRVTVKAHANPNTSEINVILVRLKDERLTAKLDDSAFRR
jgi:hypothetical protein